MPLLITVAIGTIGRLPLILARLAGAPGAEPPAKRPAGASPPRPYTLTGGFRDGGAVAGIAYCIYLPLALRND